MAKYLKLGEKAGMFFDPTSQVLIRGSEVVKVERLMKTKKLVVALNQGHVINATEEEYTNFLNGGPVKPPVVETPEITEAGLSEMTDAEFKAKVKKFGFVKKDKDAIFAIEDREEAIKLFKELSLKYE